MIKLFFIIFLFCLILPLPGLTADYYSLSFTLDTQNPAAAILIPTGGEIWFAGESNPISWSALDTNLTEFPVELYFSYDGGLDWQVIGDNLANTGLYNWMSPCLNSNQVQVKIRVTDSFGNFTEDYSDGFFSLVLLAPCSPQNIRIERINETDIRITWDPVTQDVNGNPINPDGYCVFISSNPETESQFNLLAITNEPQYLHLNAAITYPLLFYKVIAYKDSER